MIAIGDALKDDSCNSCNSKEDIKEVRVSPYPQITTVIKLCGRCRDTLMCLLIGEK